MIYGNRYLRPHPLLDWTAGNHLVERKRLIENLQQYARQKSIRVSFLGGDVWHDKEKEGKVIDLLCSSLGSLLRRRKTILEGYERKGRRGSLLYGANHFQCHCQCVSRANRFSLYGTITNPFLYRPPPQALLTILNQNSSYITFNGNTEEKMYNIFKKSPNGNTVSLPYTP